MASTDAVSPRFMARMTAAFYLLYVALASVAGFARRGILVAGNSSATTAGIMAHQSLYQLGFACDLLSVASYVVVVVLFYQLLQPVNATVAKLVACFGFMGCIMMAVGGVFQLAPLSVLAHPSGAFSAEQLQAQAYVLLRLYNQAYSIALICFGLFDFLVGYLIFRSTFLPRALGVLMMVAGGAFLVFLSPAFGAANLKWLVSLGFGEALVILWLLVKGVDVERWRHTHADSLRSTA